MSMLQMDLAAAVMIIIVAAVRKTGIHRLPAQTFTWLWALVWIRLMLPVPLFSLPVSSELEQRMSHWEGAWDTGIQSSSAVAAKSMQAVAEAHNVSLGGHVAWREGLEVLAELWPTLRMLVSALLVLLAAAVYVRWYIRFAPAKTVSNEHTEKWTERRSLWRKVRIVQSGYAESPLTYGIFRPVIVLPLHTDWTDHERVDYVLAHEYMHVRRLDAGVKMLLLLALCVHWYNPLVWLMYVLANRDLELCCDRAVVRSQDYACKAGYARTLIHMEERKASRLSPLNHFNQSPTEERIKHIMKLKKSTFKSILAACAAVGIVSTAFAVSSVSAQITDPVSVRSEPRQQTYQIGQSWTVDGEWSFKVDAVKEVAVKNSAEAKAEGNAGHYVAINYSYTNLGFDDSANFEDGINTGLAFSKANFSVSDALNANNWASGNPGPFHYAGMDSIASVKPGQSVKGAAWVYIFENSPKTIQLSVGHYDSALKLHEANFVLPVEKK